MDTTVVIRELKKVKGIKKFSPLGKTSLIKTEKKGGL